MAGGARSRPVTIIDVARHAGVSKSVVSRVLRDSGRVSPSTREAVLASIAELGYRPNAAARHLVQQRSHMVGVVVSDLHNVLFAEILDGVDEAASAEGFTVLVASGKREEAAEQHALEALLELRVECIILAGTLLSAKSILAASAQVPTAIAGGSVQVTGVDSVRTDNLAGARLAVEHLAALGHRRIALIGGPSHLDAKERRAGYLRTMDDLGLGAHAQVAEGDFTELGGYQGARELLSRGKRPTAILASNDLAAVGAMIAIQEAGLRVPMDVSLVGFDNTALAALRQISLTTIDQPGRETGLAAMRAVLHRIGDRRVRARRVLLAPALVARSTTAAPRKPSARRREPRSPDRRRQGVGPGR